jgi:hypothetical protein
MKLDDVMASWRSQSASTFYGVDKTLLHQVLRQEQATLMKDKRSARRIGYVLSAVFLVIAGLFFAIMIDPNQPPSFAARLVVWDYVVGGVGLASAVTFAGAMFSLRRTDKKRERDVGDSLRDHLLRRIAQLDDEATVERRLGLIALAALLICAAAIFIGNFRIAHVPVPYSDFGWPFPLKIVLIFAFVFVLSLKLGTSRVKPEKLARKRQLEALLKELDDL